MPTSTYFTGSIEQRLSDDLHLAGVAERTRKGYLRAVRQLAEHAKCSPDKIDEEQLRQWLLHLKVDKQLAYGSLRVAFSGIKFFFTRTCKRNWKTLTKVTESGCSASVRFISFSRGKRKSSCMIFT